MRKKVDVKNYKFDDSAVKYSELSDNEAKNQVLALETRIKELKALENLSEDPKRVMELRELYTALSWYKQNKYRSKFFKVESLGASMRKAKRHPEPISLKKRGKNDIKSCKRKRKNRPVRKAIQIFKSAFSGISNI